VNACIAKLLPAPVAIALTVVSDIGPSKTNFSPALKTIPLFATAALSNPKLIVLEDVLQNINF
jgi:hypothetical protein